MSEDLTRAGNADDRDETLAVEAREDFIGLALAPEKRRALPFPEMGAARVGCFAARHSKQLLCPLAHRRPVISGAREHKGDLIFSRRRTRLAK
jgi:hypothetical protein